MQRPFTHTHINKDITFEAFGMMVLPQMTIGIKKSTKQDLESRFNRLLVPHFGSLQLIKITPLMIERWQNDLIFSKGIDITRRTKQLLKNILNRGIVYGLLYENPIHPTTKIREQRAEFREIYTKKEVSLMLCGSDGWLHLLILMIASLGLRSGEAIGAKFSDIDWNTRKIYIQRNVKWGVVSLPKSGVCRWVDIPSHLMNELQKAYQAREAQHSSNDYIFINSRGGRWSDASSIVKRHFKPLLERLGIKYKTLYSLRHTYATLSLQGGQNIGYISEQLGHKDIKVTMDYYIKYLHDDRDLKRADEILSF